jgi:exonuclease III
MLEDFLWKHEIDIVTLQEVTTNHLDIIRRYTIYTNVGTEQRGTAIMVKHGLTLQNIRRLPTGRGLAGTFQGICVMNVYAPSGAEKRKEKEQFNNAELPHLLSTSRTNVILAGEFNCVLLQADTEGRRKNYSKTLENIIRGFQLTDVCETQAIQPTYTRYTPWEQPF